MNFARLRRVSLYSNIEDSNDLIAVLQSIIHAHERWTNSQVAFHACALSHLATDIIRAAGRVVQEALTNAFKHAHGAGLEVCVFAAEGMTFVPIRESSIMQRYRVNNRVSAITAYQKIRRSQPRLMPNTRRTRHILALTFAASVLRPWELEVD
jgi:hypothetical protein